MEQVTRVISILVCLVMISLFFWEISFGCASNEIFLLQADREKEITVEHLADIDRCGDFLSLLLLFC